MKETAINNSEKGILLISLISLVMNDSWAGEEVTESITTIQRSSD